MRRMLKRNIIRLTGGLFSTIGDILIYEMIAFSEIYKAGKGRSGIALGRAWRRFETFDTSVVKRNLYNLKRKGLIRSLKSAFWEELITEKARAKLDQIMPRYDADRPWDNCIYLTTYDIPETRKQDRNLIRVFLKSIGSVLLQKSVWLSVYNPRKLLAEFISRNHVEGQVLVSDLGREGTIGNESLPELICRLYKLDDLNQQYRQFCTGCSSFSGYKRSRLTEVHFDFLAILKKDPQLPFALLPPDWEGDKAFLLWKKATGLLFKR